MAPHDVAFLHVHLCEVERGVCVTRVGPYSIEYVLADGFEVVNSCTWIVDHEVVVGLIVVWGEPIDVKGLCLDSIDGRDGFCLVSREGVPTDVEFDEGFFAGGRV